MVTSVRARNSNVPNTRRIGSAKLPAEYCRAGLASGKPQSQIGARRVFRDARMWIADATIAADSAMKMKTRSPL